MTENISKLSEQERVAEFEKMRQFMIELLPWGVLYPVENPVGMVNHALILHNATYGVGLTLTTQEKAQLVNDIKEAQAKYYENTL